MQFILKFAKYKSNIYFEVYQKSASMKKAVLIALSLVFTLSLAAQQHKGADLSLNTVVVDAGHGGKDVGTVSLDKKTYEKTVALKIAQKFASRVREGCPDVKVVMTRDKDEFIPLDRRAKIATNAEARLFISIHVNSTPKATGANGFTAYILGSSAKYNSYDVNMEVCKRENSVMYLEDDYSTKYKDLDESSPESKIFLKLMQNAFREQSLSFAETVCGKMDAKGPFKKNLGVAQGNFAVLRLASMPAVLLEFGFMNNADDLSHLRSEDDLDRMADNLYNAFVDYKHSYDSSVSIGESKPQEQPQKVAEEKPQPAVEGKDKPDGPLYGTQVLASSRKMSASDKFFKGYEVLAVQSGTLYRYVLCPTDDLQGAKEKNKEIRAAFPDSYLVRVENGEVVRMRQ